MTRFGSPTAMTVAELGSEAAEQQVCPNVRLVKAAEPDVEFRGFSKLA